MNNKMIDFLSELFDCGIDDIKMLFDERNDIDVSGIVNEYIYENGTFPDWNTIYRREFLNFCSDYGLENGVDVDIYTNGSLDTHIYAREGLNVYIVEKFKKVFNMECETLAV